ncbi:glycosyltransferase [Salinicoccus roseus]|uniref:Sugar transferase n=1 Tax=Salinicoccus roseus TaxID=45670 RepID=A0A265EAM0_9STAP|nr:glycosyltransferase [Salinicoccus roseus]OZT78637.1 sugar transferase [Salinicoccus roseus]
MLAPVVIFVYNRPEHTKRTIEALSRNYLAKKTDVYIFSDAPKSNNAGREVELVRDYIDSLPEKNLFKSIHIKKADKNLGLANSVINGVQKIIEKYGKTIVLEDDLISSKDFLQFMNDGLNYYQDNSSIWSISGYNIPIKIPANYKSEIYLSYRGSSWGWATWKDRWEKVDWNVSDYKKFKRDKNLRRNLNRGGRDMAIMLDYQIEGKIDSWAIRWCYSQSKLGMYTIYPVVTRINNIGLDGSGTHSGITSRYDSALNNELTRCNFEDPGLNKTILTDFQNHYMSRYNYLLFQFKRVIKRIIRIND